MPLTKAEDKLLDRAQATLRKIHADAAGLRRAAEDLSRALAKLQPKEGTY